MVVSTGQSTRRSPSVGDGVTSDALDDSDTDSELLTLADGDTDGEALGVRESDSDTETDMESVGVGGGVTVIDDESENVMERDGVGGGVTVRDTETSKDSDALAVAVSESETVSVGVGTRLADWLTSAESVWRRVFENVRLGVGITESDNDTSAEGVTGSEADSSSDALPLRDAVGVGGKLAVFVFEDVAVRVGGGDTVAEGVSVSEEEPEGVMGSSLVTDVSVSDSVSDGDGDGVSDAPEGVTECDVDSVEDGVWVRVDGIVRVSVGLVDTDREGDVDGDRVAVRLLEGVGCVADGESDGDALVDTVTVRLRDGDTVGNDGLKDSVGDVDAVSAEGVAEPVAVREGDGDGLRVEDSVGARDAVGDNVTVVEELVVAELDGEAALGVG